MPPLYNEPLYVPPEETARLAEPVFDPVPRGGLARVQPQVLPQATIAQSFMPQKRSEMDYWKQPIVGGIPRDLFMTLTGQAAQAIAPTSPAGRLGGGLARMAGGVYGRRMRREEEEPERALQRKVREAQLRKLERPETVSWKSIDPVTGQERTFYGRPEDRPSETITGIPKLERPKTVSWKSIDPATGRETTHYGRPEDRPPETITEIPTKKAGAPKWSHADTQEYNYLTGRLKILDTQEQELGELGFDDKEIIAERRQIQSERSRIIDGLSAIERRVEGGMTRAGKGFGETATPPSDPTLERYIQQAMDTGVSQEEMQGYLDDPNATLEGFRKKFKLDKPEPDEVPDMKDVPINTTQGLHKYPIPSYPYRSRP